MLWIEGIRSGAIEILERKYFLADAGFRTCDFLITPYKATRYYLQE
jgi:hypothetical protein